MNLQAKKFVWPLIVILLVIGSFLIGRWSGLVQTNLTLEKNYPHVLHKKLANIDLGCESLKVLPTYGKFFVQTIDGGDTLLLATWQKNSGEIKAFALSSNGEQASDSWRVECK